MEWGILYDRGGGKLTSMEVGRVITSIMITSVVVLVTMVTAVNLTGNFNLGVGLSGVSGILTSFTLNRLAKQ